MNNARFSISLHILTLLEKAKGELLSSEYLAGSININPVLVRKELINLRNHGFVTSKEGKNGGSCLAKAPVDINLSDIYKAVRPDSLFGQSKNAPNPYCQVGRQMSSQLNTLYETTETALITALSTKNLATFSQQFS